MLPKNKTIIDLPDTFAADPVSEPYTDEDQVSTSNGKTRALVVIGLAVVLILGIIIF